MTSVTIMRVCVGRYKHGSIAAFYKSSKFNIRNICKLHGGLDNLCAHEQISQFRGLCVLATLMWPQKSEVSFAASTL